VIVCFEALLGGKQPALECRHNFPLYPEPQGMACRALSKRPFEAL
jgi:hypothetical protein